MGFHDYLELILEENKKGAKGRVKIYGVLGPGPIWLVHITTFSKNSLDTFREVKLKGSDNSRFHTF